VLFILSIQAPTPECGPQVFSFSSFPTCN
jgi:hypothetical protein